MTNYEIREEVAKLCGYSWEDYSRVTRPDGKRICRGYELFNSLLPNYPEDLNAASEMEATISDEDWPEYERHLRAVTLRDGIEGQGLYRRLIRAKATQRCEAFLHLKGKWIDQPTEPKGDQPK